MDEEGNDISEAELERIARRRDVVKLRRDTFTSRRDSAQQQLKAAISSKEAEV